MRLNPYSSKNNPAYFLPYKGYVGIPGISNFNFSLYNTGLHLNNLIVKDKNGTSIKFSPDKFVNSLAKNNWFNTGIHLELIGFGFRVDKYFFSFSYQLKIDESFRYSKDLFGFLLQGNLAQNSNGDYLYTETSPAVLSIEPNLNIYQEMSLGIQGQISDRLYVGIRPKILFGLLNLKTKQFNAKVYTNPDDFTIYGNYNVEMKMASISPFYKIENGVLKLNTGSFFDFSNIVNNSFSTNLGFAIDLGAVYRINQQIRVSASVTDLGFIRWKGTPLKMGLKTLDKEYIEFSGFNTEQIINFIHNGITINLDSIVNQNLILEETDAYSTMLTSKIMFDGYFDLTPSNRFIIQMKGYIIGKHLLPQFTVAYNGTFFNLIDIVVSYSFLKKSFDNIGLGLGLRLGPVHLYAGTDNILGTLNILDAKRLNVTAGLLIDFPITKKVKEKELRSFFGNKKTNQENE